MRLLTPNPQTHWLGINKDRLLAILLLVVSVTVYIFTLAPTITMEDSAEFVTAVATLGITHPPGFPLFVLLGKLFTLIPFGEIAWRINLMSALFGAATVSMLFVLLRSVGINRLIAVSAALVLGFSKLFWSQSLIAEVYTLNDFFVVVLLLILVQWRKTNNDSLLLWFALVYGLSLTNHTMLGLFGPVFLLYALIAKPALLVRVKMILSTIGLFILGLSVYAYLLLRASQQPSLNFGNPNTAARFWAHVTRAVYNDFEPLTNLYSKIALFIDFFLGIYQQFFLPALLLSLAGIAILFIQRGKRLFGFLTLGVFLANSVGIIILRQFGWNTELSHTYSVYYLPAYTVAVIWLAVSFQYGWDRVAQIITTPRIRTLVLGILSVLIISIPISFAVDNYEEVDLSDFWFNYDYGKAVLESLPQGSIFFFSYDGSLHGDTEIFTYLYLKNIEKIRPDVQIVNELNMFYKQVSIQLPEEFFALPFEDRRIKVIELIRKGFDGPLYVNFPVTQKSSEAGWSSRSNGIVHRVYPSLEEAKQEQLPVFIPSLRISEPWPFYQDYTVAALISHHTYTQAATLLNQGHNEQSQQALIAAIQIDRSPFNHEYRRFLDYRADWLK
ncbi:MAG: hypothetical protein A2840_00795 [Candidatus Buchananbacteria bacterium RIFCSPHIGHO2_01_FULL_47_11b]|uniref:Glycosyltransferase RgtA/B/C/D-like domain-containing protein n=1 Tax=Candidatus Buchananbacteria bacterium RIFCSPHIGHO2_01_FULL_47_11b TaxID=1797537 RepID=A0A1G1Y3J0_9BACT|nr:MAG: hypothetical protein A2840_00795 [Candidatus Buchananbacteria bacterium RIFCSPHIGHO2_01_FULL_47_11b]